MAHPINLSPERGGGLSRRHEVHLMSQILERLFALLARAYRFADIQDLQPHARNVTPLETPDRTRTRPTGRRTRGATADHRPHTSDVRRATGDRSER